MKSKVFLATLGFATLLAATGVAPAQALSCLPVEMYMKDVIGKDTVILVGTVSEQIKATDYTAEVITVTEVKQGYAEKEIYAYHEISKDWGYLCNAGPVEKVGDKGVYFMERDAYGKYNVYQRLSLTDPLVKTLDAEIKKAEVTGTLAEEITKTDRMNQILTAITDLFKEMGLLLKEYKYWKSQ